MAMNRYANITKKRVSASNAPRVVPARDGCQPIRKLYDPSASKNNQSSAKISMAQLILNKQGSSGKKGDFSCSSKEMNCATKSISTGSMRRLFDMISDDENNIDMKHDGAQNDDEYTEHVIHENIENEIEGDVTGFQDLNENEREQHSLVDEENEEPENIMFGNNQNGIDYGSDSEYESENEIVE